MHACVYMCIYTYIYIYIIIRRSSITMHAVCEPRVRPHVPPALPSPPSPMIRWILYLFVVLL